MVHQWQVQASAAAPPGPGENPSFHSHPQYVGPDVVASDLPSECFQLTDQVGSQICSLNENMKTCPAARAIKSIWRPSQLETRSYQARLTSSNKKLLDWRPSQVGWRLVPVVPVPPRSNAKGCRKFTSFRSDGEALELKGRTSFLFLVVRHLLLLAWHLLLVAIS